MTDFDTKHIPVLYGELIESLHFFDEGHNIIIDCTLGLGGHASGVIERLGRGDIFIGLDCDQTNLAQATKKLTTQIQDLPHGKTPTVYCIHSNFADIEQVLSNIQNYTPLGRGSAIQEIQKITGLYADLGVSSVHFDTPERGFSFRFNGPLDMRLDTSRGLSAADIIRTISYENLASLLRRYGDEPRAGFIAKKIIEARDIAPVTDTFMLADIVRKAWKNSITTVFQALRIAVNHEYESLEKMLLTTSKYLIKQGTISIISFHSGEDRIVKHFFREQSTPSRDPITGQDISPGTFSVITKKPITPSVQEIETNPRSRSALLRVAQKNIETDISYSETNKEHMEIQ